MSLFLYMRLMEGIQSSKQGLIEKKKTEPFKDVEVYVMDLTDPEIRKKWDRINARFDNDLAERLEKRKAANAEARRKFPSWFVVDDYAPRYQSC